MDGLGGSKLASVPVILLAKHKQKKEDDRSRALHYQETPRSETQLIRCATSLETRYVGIGYFSIIYQVFITERLFITSHP
jgi:uncharacterized membrane protein